MSIPILSSQDDYPPAVWRVIIHREADGATNMAVDEAIALQVARGQTLPTLRFYAWSPACLSLGFSQPAGDVDLARLAGHGWHLVRRLTGGRAILHVDELTYSIAIPLDDPRVAGGVLDSYRRLSQGLVRGLQLLGVGVHSQRAAEEAHGFKGPVCFEVPSDYEITVNGRKLLGSAQTRRGGNVVLQHGTLPLTGDITRICHVLAYPDEPAREQARARVSERATTLEQALGRQVSYDEAAKAMSEGFAQALRVTLLPGDLSAEERDQAARLRASRYATDEWTFRH